FERHFCERDSSSQNIPRTVFVFDDFDLAPPSIVRWLFDYFLDRLSSTVACNEFRFLMASCLSPEEVPSLLEGFRGNGIPWVSLALKPANIDEIAQALKNFGLPETLALEVHKRSEGMPAKLRDTLIELQEREGRFFSNTIVKQLVSDKSPQECKWLVWAAHIGEVSEETLRVFGCGAGEAARAFEWLRANCTMTMRADRNSRYLDEVASEGLLEWHRKEDPEGFEDANARANRFKSVAAVIPERKEREHLALLNPIAYFSRSLLRELPGVPAESLDRLLDYKKGYFFETRQNYHMEHDVAQAVKTYCELIPPENAKAVEQYASEAWNRKLKELNERREQLENEKKAANEDLARLKAEYSELVAHEPKTRPAAAPRPSLPRMGKKTRRLLVAVMLEIVGIFILYLSILFYTTATLPLSLLALIMIIAGIFWPMRGSGSNSKSGNTKKPPATVASAPSRRRRLFELQILNLDNRRSVLQQRLTRYQKTLDSIDEELREPFVRQTAV
ncbi:MAG: hypothetical protein ACOCVG_05095, partial [Verrucomicrobiota bacterium]